MWAICAENRYHRALKSCPNTEKSPYLVTLIVIFGEFPENFDSFGPDFSHTISKIRSKSLSKPNRTSLKIPRY